MYLKAHRRKKDGKEHVYYSLTESIRVSKDRVVQRRIFNLGELNTTQVEKWQRTVEVIQEDGTVAGFSISIVATENNTAIVSNGRLWFNDAGESLIVDHNYRDSPLFLTCSNPCLVAQYSKLIRYESGMFMFTILAESDFSTFMYFTTLDVSPISYISIVLKGEERGENLYLNGDSLGSLQWTALSGYTTAQVTISDGVYELESMDGRPFAAYVYHHGMTESNGAGFALLPLYRSQEPPEPTIPGITTDPTIPDIKG